MDDSIFNDRRAKPRVHPDNQMVGEPHYADPRTVSWIEREPPTIFRTGGRKTPRWNVQRLQTNDQGGSMQTSSGSMRSRKAAMDVFEQHKAGAELGSFDSRGRYRPEWDRVIRAAKQQNG
jgi:hypothetical protein